MKARIVAGVILAGLCFSLALSAEDFWVKKDYRTWTQKECRKMLEDSPWARRQIISRPQLEMIGREGRDAPQRGWEPNPELHYMVALVSALPVRQAMIRCSQIEHKYDELSEDNRAAFDGQAQQFLEHDFSQVVAVRVTYGSTVQAYAIDLARYWQNQAEESLKTKFYLIAGNGQRIPPVQCHLGRGGENWFECLFPRQLGGRPLLAPEDDSLRVEFPHPDIRNLGEERVLLEFKVNKMFAYGKLAY